MKTTANLLLMAAMSASWIVPWAISQAEAQTSLRAPRPVVWQDFLGVNAQFQYFSPNAYQQQMDMLDGLGLNWVRLSIHWPLLEPERNQYNISDLDGAMATMYAHHYNIVAYMVGSPPFITSAPAGVPSRDQYPPTDFSLFAARMVTLAQRYPQVNNWQVWNEPNIIWLPKEDPAAYDTMLTTTADALRAAVPDKTIVTAGMAYFGQMRSTPGSMLQVALDRGLGKRNIVAAYHPYTEYPEGDSPSDRDFLTKTNAMNTLLHSNGVQQVWATEWGWSSYNGPVELQKIIGLQGQADYTLRRLALMSAMDFQRIFLFNLTDLDERVSARDQAYGLLDLQGNPKPVYTALRNFLTVTGPRLEPADPPAASGVPNDLFTVAWTRADGKKLLMFWSASGTTVTLPSVHAAVVHDPLTGSHTDLAGAQGVTLALKPTLQILEWKP